MKVWYYFAVNIRARIEKFNKAFCTPLQSLRETFAAYASQLDLKKKRFCGLENIFEQNLRRHISSVDSFDVK